MKIKRILSVFMILIVMVLAGCNITTSKADEVKQNLLEYAEKKYRQKFHIVSFGLANAYADIQFDHEWVYPEDDPLKTFLIYRDKNDEGNGYEYHDGYAYRLAETLMDKRIKGIIGNEFSNLKYSSFITNGTLEYTKHTYGIKINLDDFIKKESKHCFVDIVAFLNYKNDFNKNKASEEMYTFMKKLADNNIVKNKIEIICKLYCANSNNYNKINPRELKYEDDNYIMKHYSITHNQITYSTIDDGMNYKDTAESIMNNFRK